MTRQKRERPYQDGHFSLMHDDAIVDEKHRHLMSVPWRIWEICAARANNWGHAAFRTGELVRLCCGEDTPNNRRTVNRGLEILAEMERIAPTSTRYCVIVNQYHVWRGGGKGSRKDLCAEPDHMDTRETPWTTHVPEPKFTSPPVQDDAPDDDDDAWTSAEDTPVDNPKSWRDILT